METNRKIKWESPLMQIASVDIRESKETEKDYAVVKVYASLEPSPHMKRTVFWKGKKTTLLCFKDSLLALFQPDNFHVFEGEISLDWGSTYLCITKLFDDNGNRLLRSPEIEAANKYREEISKDINEDVEEHIIKEAERKRRENDGWPCTQECSECEDPGCVVRLPY